MPIPRLTRRSFLTGALITAAAGVAGFAAGRATEDDDADVGTGTDEYESR